MASDVVIVIVATMAAVVCAGAAAVVALNAESWLLTMACFIGLGINLGMAIAATIVWWQDRKKIDHIMKRG